VNEKVADGSKRSSRSKSSRGLKLGIGLEELIIKRLEQFEHFERLEPLRTCRAVQWLNS
jgi:hypothetical protein